jgi:hypothetical protein
LNVRIENIRRTATISPLYLGTLADIIPFVVWGGDMEQQKSDGWLDRELLAAVKEVNSWPPEERAATPVARFKAAADSGRSAGGANETTAVNEEK